MRASLLAQLECRGTRIGCLEEKVLIQRCWLLYLGWTVLYLNYCDCGLELEVPGVDVFSLFQGERQILIFSASAALSSDLQAGNLNLAFYFLNFVRQTCESDCWHVHPFVPLPFSNYEIHLPKEKKQRTTYREAVWTRCRYYRKQHAFHDDTKAKGNFPTILLGNTFHN